jgi:hypothetical protein
MSVYVRLCECHRERDKQIQDNMHVKDFTEL